MFDIVISDDAVFTNINYTDHGALGAHGECFSPLSSIFTFPPPPLPHSSQLQLPDTGDRVRLANRRGVEMGDRVRPNQTGGSSLGHQGLFPWAGPPKIDRQEEYCQKGLRV